MHKSVLNVKHRYKHIGSVHLAISSIDFRCSTDIFHGDLAKVSIGGFAAREPGEIGTRKTRNSGNDGVLLQFLLFSNHILSNSLSNTWTGQCDC